MSYQLDNALLRHNQNPETFEIPSLSEIESLRPGDYAKLIFVQNGRSERMWVEIQSIKNNKYVGRLDNIPILIRISLNEIVSFDQKNIISTITIKRGLSK